MIWVIEIHLHCWITALPLFHSPIWLWAACCHYRKNTEILISVYLMTAPRKRKKKKGSVHIKGLNKWVLSSPHCVGHRLKPSTPLSCVFVLHLHYNMSDVLVSPSPADSFFLLNGVFPATVASLGVRLWASLKLLHTIMFVTDGV